MCKCDLKRMLLHFSIHKNLPILHEIATAVPTAELRPIDINEDTSDHIVTQGYTQADEVLVTCDIFSSYYVTNIYESFYYYIL